MKHVLALIRDVVLWMDPDTSEAKLAAKRQEADDFAALFD